MNILVGFDPGKSGGLVAVREDDGRHFDHLRVPLIGKAKHSRVDGRRVAKFLRHCTRRSDGVARLAVERVHAFPEDGIVGVFSFGKATGAVLGIAEALCWSIIEVMPRDWQRVMLRGHPRQPKAARKASCALVASDLHPELADELRIKANWGLADAALIAEYQRRQLIRA